MLKCITTITTKIAPHRKRYLLVVNLSSNYLWICFTYINCI